MPPALQPVASPSAALGSVLVIDDDPSVRASLSMVLGSRYRVLEAGTAEEGLNLLRLEKPVAITLDLCLPRVDGLQALREIRRFNRAIPVIILTGHATLESAKQALRSGASDYLEKPFHAANLLGALDAHINRVHAFPPPPTDLARVQESTGRDPLRHWDILHDIRNPLTVVKLQCDHILDICGRVNLSDAEKIKLVQASAHTAGKQAGFCGELISQGSDLGRMLEQAPEPLDLNEVLQTVREDIIHLAVERGITLCTRFPSGALPMRGHARSLRRMLNNLCLNAIQAAPLSTGRVDFLARYEEHQIHISVRDNGPGIPPHALDSIFLPYYTTKGNQGSGLGLHIARLIARAHRGDITAQNLPGGGCRFDVVLPRETPA
ncbi:MAG: hybrid sensor histidine kinase/response regulator [Candidatus Methylacidiphilales bacterium]|nr:hybrid sensor histidine kinase/response regulator [Candidatus Methylacidiphilales bacterium]